MKFTALGYQVTAYVKVEKVPPVKLVPVLEQPKIYSADFLALNRLYLGVENGSITLTIHIANQIRVLIGREFKDDPMGEWWLDECRKLPNWDNV